MISSRTRPRTILTYGRFDGLHQDHIRFLQNLAALGNELIVGCATDACAQAMQGPCRQSYDLRHRMLDQCRHVSRVIALHDLGQMRTDIVNYNVAALAMGRECAGRFDALGDIAQVLYLPRRGLGDVPAAPELAIAG